MLTDQQLTETVLRFVLQHLDDLTGSVYEMDDHLDKAVCEQHCNGADCDRTDQTWKHEIAVMRGTIASAVEDLRDRLIERADDEGIDLKESA